MLYKAESLHYYMKEKHFWGGSHCGSYFQAYPKIEYLVKLWLSHTPMLKNISRNHQLLMLISLLCHLKITSALKDGQPFFNQLTHEATVLTTSQEQSNVLS